MISRQDMLGGDVCGYLDVDIEALFIKANHVEYFTDRGAFVSYRQNANLPMKPHKTVHRDLIGQLANIHDKL